MKLSTKHENQQTIALSDFTGGINSSQAPEYIEKNQLSVCVNLQPQQTKAGLLETCDGGRMIAESTVLLIDGQYDKVNDRIILFSKEAVDGVESHGVYVYDMSTATIGDKVGTTTGFMRPITTPWENGLLIATGGKLQYYDGKSLTTLENSPDGCDTVFIRSGRVIVGISSEDMLRYSAVGDESTWATDSNDSSASQYLETGYKDGGKFIGAISLNEDIIIFKTNGYVYRLTGDYPNWSLKSISHEVYCDGRLSMCSLMNSAVYMGRGQIGVITTTDYYGDMKVENIGDNVSSDLLEFQPDARMVYLSALNQVWVFNSLKDTGENDGFVIFFDVTHGGFYTRTFNSNVVGAISTDHGVYVIRDNGVTVLVRHSFTDVGRQMEWKFKAQRMIAWNDYLITRVQSSFTPYYTSYAKNVVMIGRAMLEWPQPRSAGLIYNNETPIYKCDAPINDGARGGLAGGFYALGDLIYENPELIYKNRMRIFPTASVYKTERVVYRNKVIDITGHGNGGGMTLDSIRFDIVAEV